MSVDIALRRARNNEASIRRRRRDPERVRLQNRRSYQRNREARRLNGSTKIWNFVGTIHRHGLTLDQFHALYESQDGACGICGDELTFGPHAIHIDHCHQGGQVRGLLCGSCNVGLGMFREEPARFQRAIAYVTEHHRGAKKKP